MWIESSKARIFCHRGLWEETREQNTPFSFARAIENGFSIETDLHAFEGEVVISHDLPSSKSSLTLGEILTMNCAFALNLKSDGLSDEIKTYSSLLLKKGSFVFDGSIPEMLVYQRKGIPLALRLSEYEREVSWKCDTIWLDGFKSDWWLEHPDFLADMKGKTLVIVSPEIHGRNPTNVWKFLVKHWDSSKVNLAICTDKPNEFFSLL